MKTEVKSQFRLEPVVFHTLNTLFMLIVVIVTLYPFLHTMAISFNDGSDSLKGGVYVWPHTWTLQNYKAVFVSGTIYHAAFISVSRTVISTVLGVFLTTMLAYTLAQPHYIFRKKNKHAVYIDDVLQRRLDSQLFFDQRPGFAEQLLGLYPAGFGQRI